MNKRIISALILLFLAATSSRADFMVYVSEKAPHENPLPGPLDVFVDELSPSGNLYLYGDGTTRLSGLSLDLAVTGRFIKFTSASVNSPAGRWSFLDGPLVVTDTLITNIGGAAIPPGAPGVGGPVPDELPAPPGGYLLATIGYMKLPILLGPVDDLQLRIGSNLAADYEGNPAQIRLGGPNGPLVDGSVAGAAGYAGSIRYFPEPASVVLLGVAVLGLFGTGCRTYRRSR